MTRTGGQIAAIITSATLIASVIFFLWWYVRRYLPAFLARRKLFAALEAAGLRWEIHRSHAVAAENARMWDLRRYHIDMMQMAFNDWERCAKALGLRTVPAPQEPSDKQAA
jgi:hypothetical protein